jgi:hypothetical protein
MFCQSPCKLGNGCKEPTLSWVNLLSHGDSEVGIGCLLQYNRRQGYTFPLRIGQAMAGSSMAGDK